MNGKSIKYYYNMLVNPNFALTKFALRADEKINVAVLSGLTLTKLLNHQFSSWVNILQR